LLAATAVALVLSAVPALAEVITYSVPLSGSQEVPPNNSGGKGMVEARTIRNPSS
jgi:hypothetical protein